jgi:hypothetical protein
MRLNAEYLGVPVDILMIIMPMTVSVWAVTHSMNVLEWTVSAFLFAMSHRPFAWMFTVFIYGWLLDYKRSYFISWKSYYFTTSYSLRRSFPFMSTETALIIISLFSSLHFRAFNCLIGRVISESVPGCRYDVKQCTGSRKATAILLVRQIETFQNRWLSVGTAVRKPNKPARTSYNWILLNKNHIENVQINAIYKWVVVYLSLKN